MPIRWDLKKFGDFKRAFERLAKENPDVAAELSNAMLSFLDHGESMGEFVRGGRRRSVYLVPPYLLRKSSAALVVYLDGDEVAKIWIDRTLSDEKAAYERLTREAEKWVDR
jgi:hypothetical protein